MWMRFMVMHKVDPLSESGGPPPQRIIEEMGALVGDAMARGIFIDGAGLHASERRARIESRGGAQTITRGPYPGKNELIASFAMIEADTLDDAVALAARASQAIGDVELEVGRVVEPWDLGVAPDPGGMTPRFLVLEKGDRDSEQGAPPARSKALVAALAQETPILGAAALAPSRKGARSTRRDGKRTWTDGPFTEAKELIGGYCILELPALADAQRFADAYAAILGDNEIDVRLVLPD
jgi:hypothetical protein